MSCTGQQLVHNSQPKAQWLETFLIVAHVSVVQLGLCSFGLDLTMWLWAGWDFAQGWAWPGHISWGSAAPPFPTFPLWEPRSILIMTAKAQGSRWKHERLHKAEVYCHFCLILLTKTSHLAECSITSFVGIIAKDTDAERDKELGPVMHSPTVKQLLALFYKFLYLKDNDIGLY